MESTPSQVSVVLIVFGETCDIKDELKLLGFRWSPVNQAWYHLGLLDMERYEFLARLIIDPPWSGVFLRWCEFDRAISLSASG